MSMSGEAMLSITEEITFAELAQDFDPDVLSVDGLTSVLARVQQEAVAQEEQIVAGLPVSTDATMFQSSY